MAKIFDPTAQGQMQEQHIAMVNGLIQATYLQIYANLVSYEDELTIEELRKYADIAHHRAMFIIEPLGLGKISSRTEKKVEIDGNQ